MRKVPLKLDVQLVMIAGGQRNVPTLAKNAEESSRFLKCVFKEGVNLMKRLINNLFLPLRVTESV